MEPGGTLETASTAPAQGLGQFIGVPSHGWSVAAMPQHGLAQVDCDAGLRASRTASELPRKN
jgi:hypothetical protein